MASSCCRRPLCKIARDAHQASSIKHQASSIKHQASSITHQASSIKHQATSRWRADQVRKGWGAHCGVGLGERQAQAARQRGGTTSRRCPSRVCAQSTRLKLARFTPFSTCTDATHGNRADQLSCSKQSGFVAADQNSKTDQLKDNVASGVRSQGSL